MIEIEIKDTEITAGLARLDAALGDLTPVMRAIGEYLVGTTKKRFEAGVSPEGRPWAPKSPVTMENYRRRRDRPDPRPRFGASGALSTGIFHRAGRERVEWGSPTVYAGTMQSGAAQGQFGRSARGGPIPWGTIPARPFLGLSAKDRDEIRDEIAEWLSEALARD